jgi:hypothetical protein
MNIDIVNQNGVKIIAANASKILMVNEKRAKELFEKALSDNENWIS